MQGEQINLDNINANFIYKLILSLSQIDYMFIIVIFSGDELNFMWIQIHSIELIGIVITHQVY